MSEIKSEIIKFFTTSNQRMTLGIAELNVAVRSVSREMLLRCADFISDCDLACDIEITLTPEMLENEWKISTDAGREIHVENREEVAELEALALHRAICERIADFGGFLMHASCVAYNGKAYLFAAASGTGKSTQRKLWQSYLGDAVTVVDDDKPFVRLTTKGFLACGTPWNGKERAGESVCVPIGGVIFVKRGARPVLERVEAKDFLQKLMAQVYLPKQEKAQDQIFVLLDKMIEEIPLFDLSATMDEESVKVCLEVFQ